MDKFVEYRMHEEYDSHEEGDVCSCGMVRRIRAAGLSNPKFSDARIGVCLYLASKRNSIFLTYDDMLYLKIVLKSTIPYLPADIVDNLKKWITE